MRVITYAFFAVVLILGWLIGWSNNVPVTFSFLGWSSPEMPVFIFFFAFLITGITLGLFAGRLTSRS